MSEEKKTEPRHESQDSVKTEIKTYEVDIPGDGKDEVIFVLTGF